jgi:hypothetical protein
LLLILPLCDDYWAEIVIPADPRCPKEAIPDDINAAGTVAGWFYTYSYTGARAAQRTRADS